MGWRSWASPASRRSGSRSSPSFVGHALYALYYLPILVTAWFGGVGTTVVAIVSSLAAALAFVIPGGGLGQYAAPLAVFAVVSSSMLAMARAARAAHEERSFAASIVDSSDDAIVTKNLDGIIQSWNGGAERLFGYTAAEIVGRPVMTLIPLEHQDEETAILARIRRGERVHHFETVRLAKGGRRIEVSLTISPVRDRFGEIIGASKVARDITDRKRAAEEVAAERERLSRTLESIGDAVITTDADGRVAFLNPVAERLTGWRTADARQRSCDEVFRIVNEDTRQVVESPVARVLRLGTVVGLANSTVLIAADGTERPIDDSGAPILGSSGILTGVVLVFRDISSMERRRAEAERAATSWWNENGSSAASAQARSEAEHASPEQGRVRGDGVARATKPAQRDQGLDADPERQRQRRRPGGARDRRH